MSQARARRAVAYLRTTDKRLELAPPVSAEAPSVQRDTIEAWALRESVEVVSWQVDLGLDGATPIAERPGLLAAYAALRDHRAGILVAANVDRFGHDELVRWLIERAALTEGATIRTADGSRGAPGVSAPPEPAASWTRGALDLARAYDRVTVRARIRHALAERKARGERVGTVPYGYRLAEDGVHVEPDEAEQNVIATVRQLTSEGFSQRAIVGQLAAQGVTGRTGAPLRQTQVANILRG